MSADFHAQAKFQRTFELPPREAQVLVLLMREPFVTKEQIFTHLYGGLNEERRPKANSNSVNMFLSRIRRALRPYNIHITNAQRCGWQLDPYQKTLIRQIVERKENAYA
jgi:DNA-binding response OmpR family regulator